MWQGGLSASFTNRAAWLQLGNHCASSHPTCLTHLTVLRNVYLFCWIMHATTHRYHPRFHQRQLHHVMLLPLPPPQVKPGCILRRSNFNVLEREQLVTGKQVDQCKKRMNTFGFVGDLSKDPEVSCVYHSEEAENQ